MLMLLACLTSAIPAYGFETVKIGILAFRPKLQTLTQWQPLAVALKQAIPDHDFEVEALTNLELEQAVSNHQVDFVLTNPGFYILLSRRNGLSAPLATLAVNDHGRPIAVFGGVIFTVAEQANINLLSDIKGKTIAVTTTDSMGGYQAQAYELSRIGISLPQNATLIATGMPHDSVVQAVLAGRANVGFVRTGVLESMANDGTLDMKQIKIINSQHLPNLPWQISTQLYPEWPFVALPHVDENLSRRVAAVIFMLEENTTAVNAMSIHGFVVPSDYTRVSDLLKELRLPPFNEVPLFTLKDISIRYFWQMMGVLFVMGLIILLGMRLLFISRKLKLQHRIVLLQKQQLQKSEAHLQAIIENEPECIKLLDKQGRLIQMNPAGLAMIEADSFEQVAGRSLLHVISPEYRQAFAQLHNRVLAGEIMDMEFEVVGLKGGHRWLKTRAVPMYHNDEKVLLGVTRDITEHKKTEIALRDSHQNMESLLNSMAEGAYFIDIKGYCTFVNRSFLRILGYDSPDEIIGNHIHDLIHYSHVDGSHYSASECHIYGVLKDGHEVHCSGEVFRHKNGSAIPVEYWVQPIVTNSELLGAVTTFIDISERKKAEDYEQFRSGILELLATNKPLNTILEALALGVEQLNSAMVCSILLLDNEGKHFVKGVAPSLPDFYNEAIKGVEIGICAGFCRTSTITEEAVIVEDITAHPYWSPYREVAARAGIGACWSMPILSSQNKVLGTFAIYQHKAVSPGASDIALIKQSSRLASLAIEHRLAEIDLIRSELKFHSLYDFTSDALLILTEQGIFECNDAAIKMFGCTNQEDLCSRHLADLSPPTQLCGTDSKILAKQYIASAMKNDTISFEWLHKRVDTGQTFITEILLNTMFLDGKLVLQTTIRDITARKQAEIELRIAATVFESQEGMLVSDANNNILRINSAFTYITGYSVEDVVGKNPRIFQSGQHDASFYVAMWKSINDTGAWQGEIWNRRKSGEAFPEQLTITAVKDQNNIISNYVATFTDITLRKESIDKIERLAFYDPLTGLPNRRLLQDRLTPALASSHRSGRQGALLFIDMDNFKTLNDTLGHDMGDLLLQQVAQRLESCVREGDTVARLGGDEFVVMLEDLSKDTLDTATQTEIIGNKIMAILNQPYQLASHEYHSTPSIGATLFIGQEQSSEELLKQADIAMYQAKNSGRNDMRFFDPQMQASINARVAMEVDLRLGLKEDQFILYYQPQVHHNGKIIGAEVLIRWQHPLCGLVSPAEFIPLAEETRLILSIGEWVLNTACAQLKIWEDNELTRHLQLSVNVSAYQFRQADFAKQICQILNFHAINPKMLKLELTESLVLDDIDDTIFKMNVLRDIGVRFSMDDFGTGYSSLSSLKKLPLDQLKIDQSFVRDISTDLDDAIIVETIIAMANKLNVEVIAEGVETEVQRAFLELHDCRLFQGYLFSKPIPIAQFVLLLEKNHSDNSF
jgi:diguanylate cyclase (GGDEF)-like protein/PAS domain S-box-containing protein